MPSRPPTAAGTTGARGGPRPGLLLLWALVACETYTAKPIVEEDVEARLRMPTAEVLYERARGLEHPLLESVPLEVGDGVTPREASILAVLLNPDLRAMRGRRSLAAAQVIQAGILPNPRLSYQWDTPVGGLTAGTTDAFNGELAWAVNGLITRGARVSAAELEGRAIDLDVSWAEWQTALAARKATVSCLALQTQVELADEAAGRAEANLALTKQAAAQGLLSALDSSAAEAAWNGARARSLELRRQLRERTSQLTYLLGLPPTTALTLQAGSLAADPGGVPPYEDLVAGLEQRRLDLLALRLAYESREASVRAAILGQYPQIEVGLLHARDNSDLYTTGFGIAIDLPIFDRNQGRIAEERATRALAYEEYVARIAKARANIHALLEAVRAIEAQVRVARDSVPGLTRLVDAYRSATALGQADVLSYYLAWNALSDTRIRIIELEKDLAEALIGLSVECGANDLATLRSAE
ncbi:MAG: TolC family protein [Planctomycetota bacterium]